MKMKKEISLLIVLLVLVGSGVLILTNPKITGRQIEILDNNTSVENGSRTPSETSLESIPQETQTETAYSVQVHYNKGELSNEELKILEGGAPDRTLEDFIDPKNAYIAKLLSLDNKTLYISKFEIDLFVFDADTTEELEEAYFNLVMPYFPLGKAIEVYDPSGNLKLSVDVSQYARPELVKKPGPPKQILKLTFDKPDIEGVKIKDASGSENNAIIKDGETISAECEAGKKIIGGKIKDALFFDGIDDSVTIPHTDQLGFQKSDGFTISAWIKPVSREGSDSQIIVRKKPASFGQPWPYSINFAKEKDGEVQNKRIQFVVATGQNETDRFIVVTSDKQIPLNQWTFVTALWDGNHIKLYVNGAFESQVEFNGPIISGADQGKLPRSLSIGSGDVFEGVFNGLIDEVSIYDAPLNNEDIVKLFDQQPDPEKEENKQQANIPSPIEQKAHLWSFENENFLSDSINQNDFSLEGSIEKTNEGKLNQSIKLASGYLITSKPLLISDLRNSSFNLWMKAADQLNKSQEIFQLVATGVNNTSRPVASVFTNSTGLGLVVSNESNSDQSIQAFYNFEGNVSDWFNLGIVFEKEANSTKSTLYAGKEPKPVLTHSFWGNLSNPIYLVLGSSSQTSFNGLIDEVSVYGKSLSSDEIKRLSEPVKFQPSEKPSSTADDYIKNKDAYPCRSIELTVLVNSKYTCSECQAGTDCSCKNNSIIISDSVRSSEESQLSVNFFKDYSIYKQLKPGQLINISIKNSANPASSSNVNGAFEYNFLKILSESSEPILPENITAENNTAAFECSDANPGFCKAKETCEKANLNWCSIENSSEICQKEECSTAPLNTSSV